MHRLDLNEQDWLEEQASPHHYGFKFWVDGETYAYDDESESALEVREGQPVYVVYRHRETVFALPAWTLPYVEEEAHQAAERKAKEAARWQDVSTLNPVIIEVSFPGFVRRFTNPAPGEVRISPPLFEQMPREPSPGSALYPFKAMTSFEAKEQSDGN